MDACLYAINPDSTLKWRFWTTSDVRSSPAIGSDGTVYVGCWDCNLYAITSNGVLKWRYRTGDFIVTPSPAIGSDGTVYIGSNDGCLYAIEGSGTLASSPWPKFCHDNQNTGRVGGGGGIFDCQTETPKPRTRATMVRGVLALPRDMTDLGSWKSDRVPRPALLDISGRRVLDLFPGDNDVSHIAPGVYFVLDRSAIDGRPSAVTKVVIQR